ncbi:hypothetical protein H8356DRAFT_1052727 [Neocallimastix lanati (nom. inval.)]|nr:hypothetical protein H8356DRAFT_1052727 [Neocallimastix sp. JGI-2020a]
MDIYKLLRNLPLLKNYGKDVDLWIHDFEEVMDLWDIQNPKRRLIFMQECVDYALKEVLKSIEENGENKTYPSTQIIKEEFEKYLGITQNDKIWELKESKIKTNEPIPIFNINYIRKYKNIDKEMRKLITVEDYINSIKPRIYPCLKVLEQECENIEEAIKIAEKASRIEEKLNFKIDFNNYKQNYKNNYINYHNNNINKKNNKLMCFRCYEIGHKAFNCKYSFKELSIMEEKGIIEKNKRSNYRENFNKKKIFLYNKNNYNKLFGKNSNNYYYYNNNGNYSGNVVEKNVTYASNENKNDDRNINFEKGYNNLVFNNNNNNNANNNNNNFICNVEDLKKKDFGMENNTKKKKKKNK